MKRIREIQLKLQELARLNAMIGTGIAALVTEVNQIQFENTGEQEPSLDNMMKMVPADFEREDE